MITQGNVRYASPPMGSFLILVYSALDPVNDPGLSPFFRISGID